MKNRPALISSIIIAAFISAPAQASTLLITDGGSGTPYGDTGGFVVDFDSSFTNWDPDLVAGQTYRIDSISIWEASDSNNPVNSTPVYLSVFDSSFVGFTGDTSASHLGFSDNAIDHTATIDTTKITYTFTDLFVTADADGLIAASSGSGLLYFLWDDDTVRNNFGASGGVHGYQRIDTNPNANDPAYGVAVYAFGAIQAQRVPEIEISVTMIPEPSSFGLAALAGVGCFVRRRRGA